jgi:hypothetical protein
VVFACDIAHRAARYLQEQLFSLPADCAFLHALLIQRSTSHCKVTPSTISLTLAYNRLKKVAWLSCKTPSKTLECSCSNFNTVARVHCTVELLQWQQQQQQQQQTCHGFTIT